MNDRDHELLASAVESLAYMHYMELQQHATDLFDFAGTKEERDQWVNTLVMGDALVAGVAPGGSHKKQHQQRATGLATLAKGVVALAAAPGGVKTLGRHWQIKQTDTGFVFSTDALPGAGI